MPTNSPFGVGSDPRRSVPQSSVLTSTCPYLWSHSFPPQVGLGLGDLPLLTSDCCQEGKSALTLLCRILLLPTTCASRSNPFETIILVRHPVASSATSRCLILQTLTALSHLLNVAQRAIHKEEPTHTVLLIRSPENFLATLQSLCFLPYFIRRPLLPSFLPGFCNDFKTRWTPI